MQTRRSISFYSSLALIAVAGAACGGEADAPRTASPESGGSAGTGGATGNTGGSSTGGTSGVSGSGGTTDVGGAGGTSVGTGGTGGTTSTGGAAGTGGTTGTGTGGTTGTGTGGTTGTGTGGTTGTGTGGTTGTGGSAGTGGGAPAGFWGDTTTIPAAKNVMTFVFLNRTNKFADSKVYWSFKNDTLDELHSIAEMPTFDMPINPSGRLNFYVVSEPPDPATSATAPRTSKYNDFIEHTIGATTYNGNTTRVDAWGLKIAMRLHCKDGYDVAVGDDYAMFAQTREATFAQFLAEVPTEFAQLAQPPNAPYKIPRPEHGTFGAGGALQNYMGPWIDQLWSSNGITAAKPTAFCGPIAKPSLSAACHRHFGAGMLNPDGSQNVGTMWNDGTKFYPAAPANYYAKFFHDHGLLKRAYGFPYDDVGGWSSYVSHGNPQYMIVAIGW